MFAFLIALAVPTPEIVLDHGLMIGGVVVPGRTPAPVDYVMDTIAGGKWVKPAEGAKIHGQPWKTVKPGKDGAIEADELGAGYYYAEYESPVARTAILQAEGDSTVYVNGEIRAGDPYSFGYLKLPIQLKKGANTFLFSCGRGRIHATLKEAPATPYIQQEDATLPNILPSDSGKGMLGQVTVVNPTDKAFHGVLTSGDGQDSRFDVGALSIAKVPFSFRAHLDQTTVRVGIAEMKSSWTRLQLQDKKPTQVFTRTFLSDIDGSVQYYAVCPPPVAKPGLALVLSLHGASVEAPNQANSYAPKDWAYIICPTNRRPFGFDWEEWGRLDALEVLNDAKSRFHTAPLKQYLTGHSMGGHGSWHIGTLRPDLFAAVAPSAGWISFATYGGGLKVSNPNAVEKVLLEATAVDDTVGRIENLRNDKVFILHGDADDNVPISEARTMAANLAKAKIPYGMHEQKGAGHWWSEGNAPGARCVDYADIFDMFQSTKLLASKDANSVNFTTPYPGAASGLHWATIQAQFQPMRESTINLNRIPSAGTIQGTTSNVSLLGIDLREALPTTSLATIRLDGQSMNVKGRRGVWLTKKSGKWKLIPTADRSLMTLQYGGTDQDSSPVHGFKNALIQHITVVYGTHGTPGQNAWMKNLARYYVELFAYRGNGRLAILSDDQQNQFGETHWTPDDLLVIGNESANSYWSGNKSSLPVRISSGIVSKPTSLNGDFAVLFQARSRYGDHNTAYIGFTGPQSMRTIEKLGIFTSGVQYPDLTVLSPEIFTEGTKGVVEAKWWKD